MPNSAAVIVYPVKEDILKVADHGVAETQQQQILFGEKLPPMRGLALPSRGPVLITRFNWGGNLARGRLRRVIPCIPKPDQSKNSRYKRRHPKGTPPAVALDAPRKKDRRKCTPYAGAACDQSPYDGAFREREPVGIHFRTCGIQRRGECPHTETNGPKSGDNAEVRSQPRTPAQSRQPCEQSRLQIPQCSKRFADHTGPKVGHRESSGVHRQTGRRSICFPSGFR